MELIFEKSRSGRKGSSLPSSELPLTNAIPTSLLREEPVDLPELSELDVVRHYTNLSRLNLSVDTHFYPLGSCTMKYNPKFHEKVVNLSGFSELHPLLPQLRLGGVLTQGALEVIYGAERILSELLGFAACTMQPMAGAHGELTGVMIIAAYFRHRKEENRKIMLIPDAAHGTNPASATMAGFECKVIATDNNGNVDIEDLKRNLSDNVAGIMLTCPNTLGLYDPNVEEITSLVHEAGGLNYCDGANFNAIMGRVRPGDIGFDVMHVNVHKSFSTPHGGGGPGAGPVGVSEKLVEFLPISRVSKRTDGTFTLRYDFPNSVGYIAPFYGNFGVILKAYAYMLTLGKDGFRRVGENAVLNANYILEKLKNHYALKYDRMCMHECVLSASKLLEEHGIRAMDIAKGLIDKGYHPPTMYFPLIIPEALMVEPTETESKDTLDAFIAVMIELANLAETDPQLLHDAPITTPVGRMDETAAARKPVLSF